jgi:hypothetical protein
MQEAFHFLLMATAPESLVLMHARLDRYIPMSGCPKAVLNPD